MNGPAWPDAQPWENYVFAIAAVIVVVLNRKSMLTRDGAVTSVLIPSDEIGHRPQPSYDNQGSESS